MNSPVFWFGGKGNMITKLLKLIPEHNIYCEPFFGGGSLFFAKKPAPVEVINDINHGLINFYRVLRDVEKFKNFHRLVSLTPYSREEYNFCRETWEECKDETEKAYRWFVVARMSFSGIFGSGWAIKVKTSSQGIAGTCSVWINTIKRLPEIHERLMQTQIENRDFREIIKVYDTPTTLFYFDPPYILDTRKGGGYKHELDERDHIELVNILLKVKGKVLLSGYKHEIYKNLEENGWFRRDYKTVCFVTKTIEEEEGNETRQTRIESVWISPNCKTQQELLFD